MIISHAHHFVFFHNPKAGGTSVRASIECYNDIGFGLWGADPSQTGGITVDRAHMGVDEFAGYYPDLWARVRNYEKFCLVRDPVARFLSSVSEHSKMHGDIDIRFSTPRQRVDVLFSMIERLKEIGQAENDGLIHNYELTHFRPQWLYWHTAEPGVHVQAIPVENMAQFFGEIARLTGAPIDTQIRNTREQLALPGPLAAVAASGRSKRFLAQLPGAGPLKSLLRQRYAVQKPQSGGFELTDPQSDQVADFVRHFYAEDYARWPL